MRRFLFGFLWFIAFLTIGIVGLSIYTGISTKAPEAHSASEAFAQGEARGEAIGEKFGGIALLGSLSISIAGTLLRVLPGTRKKK